MSIPRRGPIVLEAAERRELERRAAARTASQQAAYRAKIILRAAAGQTDERIARERLAGLQARLVVLACQHPAQVDPTRAGQTHWTVQDLAAYVAAPPELGLGAPSRSTVGVVLKRHKLRLDRL